MNIFEENKAYINLPKAGLAYQYKSNIEDTLKRVDMRKVRTFIGNKDLNPLPECTEDLILKTPRGLSESGSDRRNALEWDGYYFRDFTGDWNLQRQYYGE